MKDPGTVLGQLEETRAETLRLPDTLTHEGGLAPMNGLEWFEGYAFHEAFHHQQIADVMALFSEWPGSDEG